jgi:uncharacterized protein (DUF1330 family)
MTATLVTLGTLNPNEDNSYTEYATQVLPLLEQAGGKVLTRLQFREALVGEDFPQIVFVMEFPHAQAIKDTLQSPAYRKLIPYRDRAFRHIRTFIGDAL